MAYNLQSLITILEQILNPQQTRWILDHNKPQLESLVKKAASLQKIIDNSSVPRIGIEWLESRIRDTSHKAEDVLELQMADQIRSCAQGVSFTFSTPDLQQVIEELDSAMEQLAELLKGNNISTAGTSSSSGSSSAGASSSPDPDSRSKSSIVVGVDADLMRLKDRLIGTKTKLEIIPIVGMGGVGKTTLARKLYEDPLILYHFKYLAWSTISQDYNMKAILLDLLRCLIGDETDKHVRKGSDELRDVMYKSLFGRKYMIVLDDVWSTGFWDVTRKYFPDNGNGSRIVITTRELNVAKYADSQSPHHEVQLLNASNSWDLLREIVFGEEDCPGALQETGVKIAGDCGGLPLAINVIGGLLSKIGRSKDVWEDIGKDVRAAIAESDMQFSRILYLSYNHLPNHLKPCFLYMGGFPEDYEIEIFKLTCMWIAEGFVKSNGVRSLEEEAEEYLKGLVERNLLVVGDYGYDGKARKCSMHDLLRDVCMRKADEEKFLHIRSGPEVSCSELRRVTAHTSYGLGMKDVSDLASLTRSFLYTGLDLELREIGLESLAFFALKLLRVLDIIAIAFDKFPAEILQLVNLRYLGLHCDGLPAEISKLCNLQILVGNLDYDYVPSELLEMSELRHMNLYPGIWMRGDYMKRFCLEKLETISNVVLDENFGTLVGRGLFENFPNIKELGIYFSRGFGVGREILNNAAAVDLRCFQKLETLTCQSSYYYCSPSHLSIVEYPCSLKKLSLVKCFLSPSVLTTLCALSKLEALEIHTCVFGKEEDYEYKYGRREEWEVAEGDVFLSLKYLKLRKLELASWRADETNFPRLRQLFIRDCYLLEDIPPAIAEISALQLIEVRQCCDTVMDSAKHIQEVQQSDYGDYTLQVRIYDRVSDA